MTNLQWKEIRKNIFCVYNDLGEGVIYSPLHGKLFSVEECALDIVNDYIELGNPEHHPFHDVLLDSGMLIPVEAPAVATGKSYQPSEAMISLSNSCNLRCIYCYAETGNKRKILPWPSIVRTVSQLFKYAVEFNRETVEICFHGTGETLMRWDTLVKTVEFALSTKPLGVGIDFSIVTNGTLLDDRRVSFFAANDFFVTISLDGLESVQNRQRPKVDGKGSFEDVEKGLKALLKAGIQIAIRSTITGDNQHEMPDFVRYCVEIGCKNITLMPFSAVGRGANGIAPLDKDIFVEKFLDAKNIALQFGVDLRMPGAEIEKVRASICGACGTNCEITPDGDVSCCSRVTKKEDPLAKVFFVGKVTNEAFSVDQDRVNALRDLNVYSFKECTYCFAKYLCSGGCHHDRLTFGGMPSIWCEIARELVWHELRDLAAKA